MIHFNPKHKLSKINAINTSCIMVYDKNNLYESFVLIEEVPTDKFMIGNRIFTLTKEQSKNTYKATYKEEVLPGVIALQETIIKKLNYVRKEKLHTRRN